MAAGSISRDQARLVDRRATDQYGMSGLVLMENAGRGVADVLCRRLGDCPDFCGTRPQESATLPLAACRPLHRRQSSFAAARATTPATASSWPATSTCAARPCACWSGPEPAELTGDAGVNFEIIRRGARH